MKWHLYRVVFRLLAPLHIGWRKMANLQQTRPYVPAKNIWGALTFQLARLNSFDYENTGKEINVWLRFSYFYPSTNSRQVDFWPWDDENEFNWRYLNSYVSTALRDNVAETGKLHETEYVAPLTREGRPVYLIGYIMERTGAPLQWREVLERIQLGGERGNGWGRLELKEIKETENCFGLEFSAECNNPAGNPKVKVKKEGFLLAHTMPEGIDCRGQLEPFIGRETSSDKGFGGMITQAKICWMPGSRFKGSKTDSIFEIQPKDGIWIKETEVSI